MPTTSTSQNQGVPQGSDGVGGSSWDNNLSQAAEGAINTVEWDYEMAGLSAPKYSSAEEGAPRIVSGLPRGMSMAQGTQEALGRIQSSRESSMAGSNMGSNSRPAVNVSWDSDRQVATARNSVQGSAVQALENENRRLRQEYERLQRQIRSLGGPRPGSSDWMIREWEEPISELPLSRVCRDCGHLLNEGEACGRHPVVENPTIRGIPQPDLADVVSNYQTATEVLVAESNNRNRGLRTAPTTARDWYERHLTDEFFAYQFNEKVGRPTQQKEEVVQLVDGDVGSAWKSLPVKK